jgi:mRNA interferase HicA
MTYNEFKRWLLRHGCKFSAGHGSHKRVQLGFRVSTFPEHGKREIGTGLVNQIKKDLGLK